MEPEEFKEFFLRVYPQLVAYVRQAHDASIAEDLASRTLEDIWTRREPAPTDEHSFNRLRKFAFAILRRHIGHHIRGEAAHRRREHVFAATQKTQAMVAGVFEQVGEPVWPDWAKGLRDEERQLLSLHAHGYKVAEIARVLGVRPSAVSARLQRVKNKSRKLRGSEVDSGETERR